MIARRGTLPIPEPRQGERRTGRDEIDTHVAALRAAAPRWVDTGLRERIAILGELRTTVAAVAREWVEAACLAKGITLGTGAEGEEWQSGPWATLHNLRLLERSLRQMAEGRPPKLPGKLGRSATGQVTVPVFPTDLWDRALFGGFTAEVWMDPRVGPADVIERQALSYRPGHRPPPRVSLVLGAGNISSIAPMDTLYELFGRLRVVILKMNPVNDYLGPILERALAPLMRRDLVRFVYGGVEEGRLLTEHPDIDHIHMTGSDKTYEAIVFGTGEEGARRKAADLPRTTKSVSAELGNVTPVIVVPGPWSQADIDMQAESLAVMLAHNAGFNCIAARVLVQHETWEQRDALLDALADVFDGIPPRHAYYPGADARMDAFLAFHPEARTIGHPADGALPWMIISGLDPQVRGDICFTTESFASVMSEVGLAADSPAEFLDRAVEFCNESVWGSLGVSIIVHPASRKDPAVRAALERAVARLRYGTIAINQWTGIGYAMASTPWGAHPGHHRTDIQSGVDVVHNTYLLSDTQKTVVSGPWKVVPKPTWFPTHRTSNVVLERLTYFEAAPSIAKLSRVIAATLQG